MASTSERGPSRNRPVGSPPDSAAAAVRAPATGRAGSSPARTAAAGATADAAHEEPHEDHGHSVAAWTAVGVVMLGCLIMCVAVVVASLLLFVVGAVVVVAGAVLGKLLGAMGYGSKGRATL